MPKSIIKYQTFPACYALCRVIFLPCVCFASIYASTTAKSYILNYMRTAANFIIEGHMRPYVVHRCFKDSYYSLVSTKQMNYSISVCHVFLLILVFPHNWRFNTCDTMSLVCTISSCWLNELYEIEFAVDCYLQFIVIWDIEYSCFFYFQHLIIDNSNRYYWLY